MSRTFTTATDDSLIALIAGAQNRLAVIAPGLTTPVARALAARMKELPTLSLTVILDADAEVYRMGYGDAEALEIIRETSINEMFDLREQTGVRIGVVISDYRTMVYAPVSRNVEAGSTTEEKPNAIILHGGATEKLAEATGAAAGETEVGVKGMEPARVAEMAADLKTNPPHPFDLTRKLKVFVTEVQFIELRMPNATFSSHKIKLPPSFQKFEDESLRRDIDSSLKIPIDLETELDVSIKSYRGDETLKVNEAAVTRERREIERVFIHNWKGRGKVILRNDKDQVINEMNRLVEIIKEYHNALKALFDDSKKAFSERLVSEFLGVWQKSPPEHLMRRRKTDKQSCRQDIESEAEGMFQRAVALGTTEAKVVYKDISIEDLKDEKLMDGLRRLMENAGVDQATVRRLFQSGDAAAAKDSFPKV